MDILAAVIGALILALFIDGRVAFALGILSVVAVRLARRQRARRVAQRLGLTPEEVALRSPRKERPIFGRDIPWKDAREKLCRVIGFTQLAKVENGKVVAIDRTTPYGLLTVECEGLSGEVTTWVSHRIDFLHVWEAFGQRDQAKGEEVIVVPLPHRWNVFLPILLVWLCPKGAFDKMIHPELREKGEVGFLEIAPAKWGEGLQRP